jgi:hypothetical protein
LARSEEGRWAYLSDKQGKGLALYVGGAEIDVPAAASELARTLCASRRHDGRALEKLTRSRASRALLRSLFAMGALSFGRR